jgi:hypothetical protein
MSMNVFGIGVLESAFVLLFGAIVLLIIGGILTALAKQ